MWDSLEEGLDLDREEREEMTETSCLEMTLYLQIEVLLKKEFVFEFERVIHGEVVDGLDNIFNISILISFAFSLYFLSLKSLLSLFHKMGLRPSPHV